MVTPSEEMIAGHRAWGGDAVLPFPGLAIKGEAAWLKSRDKEADDYGLWVLQGERQQGEWLFIGGYVGEWVSVDRAALRSATFLASTG